MRVRAPHAVGEAEPRIEDCRISMDAARASGGPQMTGPVAARETVAATGAPLVIVPVVAAALSGLFIAVFNGALGANASFKQVYAVVTHSAVLVALQQLFSFPMFYATHSMSSTTSLGVFFQFLDQLS